MKFRLLSFALACLWTGKLLAQSVVTNPAPDSVLASSSITFQWTDSSGAGATDYGLSVGTTGPGSSNLFYAPWNITALSQAVANVPTNAYVYVRLTTWGPTQTIGPSQDYVYNADLDNDGIRNLIDPSPNSANAKIVRTGTNYTFTLLGSGRLASLQVDATLWDPAADGMAYDDYKVFTRMVYEQMGDDFDFIFFSHDQSSAPVGTPYAGQHVGVRNTVQGIGKSIYNATAAFGSAGKLQGAMHLTTRGSIQTGPSLHEIMHQWANDLDEATFPQVGSGAAGHWGASSVGGTLGGFELGSLVNLGGGSYQVKKFSTFTGAANTTPYAPLELYCAGLVPAGDVPDTKIAIGFANYTQVSSTSATFTASTLSNVTIGVIAAANGSRSPDSTSSQKRFKLLHVVLCKAPLTNPVWADIDEQTYYFGLEGTNNQPPLLNFWQATGGRAALEVTNLAASLLAAPGVTTSLVTLVANPTNGGSVLGGGSYVSGTSITITAVGSIGWKFDTWNDGNTNASRTIVVPATNITYTANFSVLAAPSPNIVTGAVLVVNETCLPTNGAVDGLETVTVSFELRNTGSGAATNLTATLLTNGSALNVSGPQNYGALAAGGGAVARTFTFTALGSCGGKITNTFQLADGITPLGTVSFVLNVGGVGVTFAENFDGVTAPALPAGWSTTSTGAQAPWVTAASTPNSAPNAAYASSATSTGESYLVSATVTVQSASATLSFRHRYDLEETYDGGVFEIKIGGGAFQDILAAGGSFATNGYTSTMNGASPLLGRTTWTGSTTGNYITTTINLPAAAAGQPVQFRWHSASDTSDARAGWYVDNITLTDLACCTPPPPNIVRLAQGGSASVTVHSTGHGAAAPTAEYTTNLFGPQGWLPAPATNAWVNGTNVTTFAAPPGANPAFIRVKQANGP